MTAILDAVRLALSSIWANKLRSFMMVLGNIVAVTSIIAVVSLIQGMDTYVSDAILRDVGVGTFKIDKIGFITDEEEERRAWRRNPDVTMHDVKAVESFSDTITAVMAEAGASANISYKDVLLESTRVRGRVGGLRGVQHLRGRARPAAEPARDRARPGRGAARLGHRRQAVQGPQPDRSGHPDQRHPLPRRWRQREEGVGVRQLAGRVRDDSSQRRSSTVRIAPLARADGQAGEPRTS